MQNKHILYILFCLLLISCQNNFYTEEDFSSVLKIDSHIHINSDDGVFEAQADEDNFLLISLNVDHSDSATIRKQFEYASLSVRRHPGKSFSVQHSFLILQAGALKNGAEKSSHSLKAICRPAR